MGRLEEEEGAAEEEEEATEEETDEVETAVSADDAMTGPARDDSDCGLATVEPERGLIGDDWLACRNALADAKESARAWYAVCIGGGTTDDDATASAPPTKEASLSAPSSPARIKLGPDSVAAAVSSMAATDADDDASLLASSASRSGMHDTSFSMAGPKRLRLRLIQQMYLLLARDEICAAKVRTRDCK